MANMKYSLEKCEQVAQYVLKSGGCLATRPNGGPRNWLLTPFWPKRSSSSAKAKSSSSKKNGKDALQATAQVPQFSLFVDGRTMQIVGARVGTEMAVFDLQGHRVLFGIVNAANFSVAIPRSGSYLVRIDGQTKIANVK